MQGLYCLQYYCCSCVGAPCWTCRSWHGHTNLSFHNTNLLRRFYGPTRELTAAPGCIQALPELHTTAVTRDAACSLARMDKLFPIVVKILFLLLSGQAHCLRGQFDPSLYLFDSHCGRRDVRLLRNVFVACGECIFEFAWGYTFSLGDVVLPD